MAIETHDPVLEALDRAPLAEDDLFEDELAEMERRSAEMRSEHVRPVEQEDVLGSVAAMHPLAG
jgi:hypothetical protein